MPVQQSSSGLTLLSREKCARSGGEESKRLTPRGEDYEAGPGRVRQRTRGESLKQGNEGNPEAGSWGRWTAETSS